MEITPNELRDIEISRAVRGYDTHEVHELLDRAADTIEALHARVSELGNAMAAPVAPAPSPEATTDAAARTLALAQRVADETVEEAKAQASAIIAEAETTQASLIGDAEAEVQRIQQTERARVEAEIAQLDTRRLELDAAVDELERFESGYRERLTAMLRDDLERIGGQVSARPGERPHVEPRTDDLTAHDADATDGSETTGLLPVVDGPTIVAPLEGSAPGTDASDDAVATVVEPAEISESVDATDDETTDGASAAPTPPLVTPVIGAAPLIGSALDPDPVPTIDLAQEQAADRVALDTASSGRIDAGAIDEVDDDDFFASLREATSEHAAVDGSEARLFDSDDDRDSSFRDVFKRRR
jgi:DivIVA domain-containing protein